jgi:hypothetical protein
METLRIEGKPSDLRNLEQELAEELTRLGVAELVNVSTQTLPVPLAPDELGFGEEVKQIMVGVAQLLNASKEAVTKLAQGVAKRLVQRKLILRVKSDGTLVVDTRGELSGTAELTAEIRKIIEAQLREP